MKGVHKYPQRRLPYEKLLQFGRQRTRNDPEYQLADTGIFAGDRYFDICVEHAKNGIDDVLIRVTATNRGHKSTPLQVLPTAWFRDEWLFHDTDARDRLFTDNATNYREAFGAQSPTCYSKDGIDRFIVGGDARAINRARTGTKMSLSRRRLGVRLDLRSAAIRGCSTAVDGRPASPCLSGYGSG